MGNGVKMRLWAFAATFASAAALGQPAPDWRAALVDLYRIDIAFDACNEVKPSAADLLRLEGAISFLEEKSALEEDELDDVYGDVEAEAAQLPEFCKRMADAVARVKNIPPEYR
jgi:hypothetical protein